MLKDELKDKINFYNHESIVMGHIFSDNKNWFQKKIYGRRIVSFPDYYEFMQTFFKKALDKLP